MRAEDVQAGLLGEQRLAHLFRQRALDHLLQHHKRCGETGERSHEAMAVRVFLEPLGQDVPSDVPATARGGDRALNLAETSDAQGLLKGDAQAEQTMRELYNEVLALATRGQQQSMHGSGGGHALPMEAEVIQEVEQEAEAEEEQEQEQEQEQEKNQEQEELTVQEAGKQSYSREDESVRPWAVRHLAQPPSADQESAASLLFSAGGESHPFYPWSRFAVYKSGLAKAKPLAWPQRMWISNNFFRSNWSLRSYRRLKNVICAMEWQPPLGAPMPMAMGVGQVKLTDEQCARVKAAFSYMDEDGDGRVTASELATLGRAVDLEAVAQIAATVQADLPALGEVEVLQLVEEQLRSHSEGPGSRYWVLLSLVEAESLRGALHVKQERAAAAAQALAGARQNSAADGLSLPSGLPSPLSLPGQTNGSSHHHHHHHNHPSDGGVMDDTMLDALVALHTGAELLDAVNYSPGSAYEQAVVRQCFRFLSSETEYAARDQHLLLRCMRLTPEPKQRQDFFSEVRLCRRRVQSGWEKTAVAAVLTEADEFALFEHRALLAATQRRLAARGLSLRQAFHAFNSSRTGNMTCSELYSGLRWLEISPSNQIVHALVTRLDSDADGLLSCDDFVAGFAQGDPTADTSALATLAPGQQELFIPLHRIPELHVGPGGTGGGGVSSPGGGGGGGGVRGPIISLNSTELSQFVVAIRPCTQHAPVIRQPAMGADAPPLTLHAPLNTGTAKAGSLTVPVGHYAVADHQAHAAQNTGGAGGGGGMRILELRDLRGSGGGITGIWGDSSRVRLYAALDQALPPPARFRDVWTRSGANPLTIWAAVPPTNDFVALGMVATATGPSQRPPLDIIRCVPIAWVRKAEASERVYNGAEGSLWRSKHGLLHAAKGRHPPPVYELTKAEISLSTL